MSQEQLMTTTDNSLASVVMQRKAVNSTGHLGSLYDGCRDRLIVQSHEKIARQQFKSNRPAKCVVSDDNAEVRRHVLRMIDIEDDLRVSLLLNLTHKIGIVAILNDSHRINEYTRVLYYSWIDREEQVLNEGLNKLKWNKLLKNATYATHLVTGITFGIDVLVMLQLRSEPGRMIEIDRILQKIASSMSNAANMVSLLTPEEDEALSQNIQITVYSNIPDLTGARNISKLFQHIDIIKRNSNQSFPISYSLRPLALLCSQHIGKESTFHVLPPELNNQLERYVLDKRTNIIILKSILYDDVRKFLSGYLNGRLYGANQQILRLEKKYFKEIKQLSELVTGFRNGQVAITMIKDALIDNEPITLRNDRNELIQNLYDLEAKAYFISDLQNRYFRYCNAVERDIDKHDNERTVRSKLMMNDLFVQILCSNDTLNRDNQQQLNKLLSDLIEERQTNPRLHLIFADFSYCSYNLHHMQILSPDHSTNNRDLSMRNSRSSVIDSRPSVPLIIRDPSPAKPIPKARPAVDTTNILLLGETGVGKSTFINAFANYLKFNSLTQAQSSQPTVIIPVSFIITVGDKFEEHTVKFGEPDSSNNENFNTIGQSVTQHCKSYVFDLKDNRRNLRIIDTPGFGDTRGLDQDDRNMEHILQYINNLSHLNAICFLLKPNSSRLNMFFRTCLTQLFSFLAPAARGNVIFCFTNARSTFYTPGDTAPLLKDMLASSSISGISFRKENTFCFDSESFRYLVALRNRISFTEEDKHEYETSWATSVKESNRLIAYINQNLSVHHMRNGYQSIKHAQFEISHMIRPILETMRNILRNLILGSSKTSIELRAKAALRPIAVCLSCKRHPLQVGRFWIMPDNPHELTNECHTCRCSITRHKSMDYQLEYRAKNNSSSYRPNEMNDMLQRLYFASAELSHFLIHGARSTKEDLFILGLLQMIGEEKEICAEKQAHEMNLQLINELEKVRQKYEQRMHEVASNRDRKTLRIIYEQIKTIGSYPEIHEQMVAIKQGQEAIMKQHEVVL